MEWYYVWWPWLTLKRVAQVCQHQLSFFLFFRPIDQFYHLIEWIIMHSVLNWWKENFQTKSWVFWSGGLIFQLPWLIRLINHDSFSDETSQDVSWSRDSVLSVLCIELILWLGSVVVRALDLQSTGRGFDSRPPPHCRVATLGKSFTRAQRLWSYDRMAL